MVTPLVSVRKTACYLLRAEVFVQRKMSHGRVNLFLWHASPSSSSQEYAEICFRIEQRFAGLSVMCLATILIDDPSHFHCFSCPHLPCKIRGCFQISPESLKRLCNDHNDQNVSCQNSHRRQNFQMNNSIKPSRTVDYDDVMTLVVFRCSQHLMDRNICSWRQTNKLSE